MPKSGFKGISFPFRVGPQGGCIMTTTSPTDPTHIKESIMQIFGTDYLQRVMEADVYSTITTSLFEPNDESLQSVLKSRIVDDLERLEERVSTTEDDIDFVVEENERGSILYAIITFNIIIQRIYY